LCIAQQDHGAHLTRSHLNDGAELLCVGCLNFAYAKEKVMPVLLIPILWVAGSAVVLGGGYLVVAHVVH